jgi:hypothetical protein
MSYSPELSELIDNKKVLDYSSTYEVEIRAMTIVAVDMILSRIQQDDALKKEVVYAY